MSLNVHPNINSTSTNPECKSFLAYTVHNGPAKIIGLVAAFFLSHALHHALKPLAQPRITSDIAIGLFLGNIPWIRNSVDERFVEILNFIAEFGMLCYMFVLGLEMDPYVIFKPPTRDALVAYSGMVSTFILCCCIIPFLKFSLNPDIGFTLTLSISLSGSGSHILTRIITNLKIGKSDIGKLLIAAGVHSDMISMILVSIGCVFIPSELPGQGDRRARWIRIIVMGSALLGQSIFAAMTSPIFMNWVNNENPEGKAWKGSHLVLSIAFMALICSASTVLGYNPTLSAFMGGIFIPKEGRISKWAVGKINYILSTAFYPFFFFWMGFNADFLQFEPNNWHTWVNFFVIAAIVMAGKVIGIIICGSVLGFQGRESAELGFLLSTKGHFHVFFVVTASKVPYKIARTSTCIIVIIVIFFTAALAPLVLLNIIKRAKKNAPTHRRALQWLDQSNELRVLLCLQGLHGVPASLNFVEITRGTPNPGIMVYLTDMVELTDQIAATLIDTEGVDNKLTVTDNNVTQMRKQITAAAQSYEATIGEGVTIRRKLALSSVNAMASDICALAEDLMVSLIILPFHMFLSSDGKQHETSKPGFRYVNRKVLRNAPCSVGILVDRGFGLVQDLSTVQRGCTIGVLFIGGNDDREALAYAGRVAPHRGVKLTVIRFILEKSSETAPKSGNKATTSEQEAELKVDDECFAQFYERYVAGGHIAYTERHVDDSAGTYASLKSLEGQYSLIIVGRGGRVNSLLTVGMNDWQQCPELGPVGDVLSRPDFSVTTSILIIQQHCPKGDLDGVDISFSIM